MSPRLQIALNSTAKLGNDTDVLNVLDLWASEKSERFWEITRPNAEEYEITLYLDLSAGDIPNHVTSGSGSGYAWQVHSSPTLLEAFTTLMAVLDRVNER